MTSASPRSLDPEVLARISALEFRARHIVEGLVSGRHASPFRGGSATFAQHRQYSAGDDLRYLDWKIWAKSDRLYVKEFEEETNLRATLVLDASASMNYGAADTNKFAYARLLAGSLAYLLLRQSDSVGLIVGDEEGRTTLPHRNQQGHLKSLLAGMTQAKPAGKIDFSKTIARVLDVEPKRGLVVFFSDFFVDPESIRRGLQQLRQRRHDVVLFHLLHDDEIEFPFQGTTRFESLEGPEMLTCDPVGLRRDYKAALERFLGTLRRNCASDRVDYRLVRTREPMDAVLSALLRERMRP